MNKRSKKTIESSSMSNMSDSIIDVNKIPPFGSGLGLTHAFSNGNGSFSAGSSMSVSSSLYIPDGRGFLLKRERTLSTYVLDTENKVEIPQNFTGNINLTKEELIYITNNRLGKLGKTVESLKTEFSNSGVTRMVNYYDPVLTDVESVAIDSDFICIMGPNYKYQFEYK